MLAALEAIIHISCADLNLRKINTSTYHKLAPQSFPAPNPPEHISINISFLTLQFQNFGSNHFSILPFSYSASLVLYQVMSTDTSRTISTRPVYRKRNRAPWLRVHSIIQVDTASALHTLNVSVLLCFPGPSPVIYIPNEAAPNHPPFTKFQERNNKFYLTQLSQIKLNFIF